MTYANLFKLFVGFVCGALRKALLRTRHVRISVMIPTHIATSNDLIPHTSCGISTIDIIKMIPISTKGVAKFCFPSVLDRQTAGNEF